MKDINDIHLFSLLENIPYENISKILRLEMDPEKRPRDSQTLLADHRDFHFGGTCFSLVNLVVQSLSVEGLRAYPVKADIHRRTFPHFFAIVEENDKKYLIDPGYLINTPIEIKEDGLTIQKNGAIDFVVKHIDKGQHQLQTITKGQHKTRYTFHIEPLSDNEFQESWIESFNYMNAIVASRFVDEKFIYINGNYVQIRSKGNIEKYDQEEKALEYLNTYFELDENIVHTANELLKKYLKK
ncbi:MAG: arylamine N-acetyltransferase [Candidatus Marinimicrobia bacterium]|nr:arylamine N-acetyltransferase [Candidatus Neomarinimicrobiota bacterium]